MRHLFLMTIFLLITGITGQAQKIIKTTQELNWNIANVDGDDFFNSYVFDKYVLDAGPAEKYIPIRLTKNSWGAAKINSEGKVIWQNQVTGFICGIGKSGNNIMAISSAGNQVFAQLFDGYNGKLLESKLFFNSASKFGIEVNVQNNSNGLFNSVLIQTITENEPLKIQLIYLNDHLSSKLINLKFIHGENRYLGSIVNKSNQVLLATLSEDHLIANQFDSVGNLITSIASSFVYKKYPVKNMVAADQENENGLIVGFNYPSSKKSSSLKVFIFDLGSKKVIISNDEELDKEFVRSVDLKKPKDAYNGSMKEIEDLEIIGFVQTEGKVVMISEIRTGNHNKLAQYDNHAWILSFYNRDLKLLNKVALDKFLTMSVPMGLSLGFHKEGDKLLIISHGMKGLAAYATIFSSVNLKTEQIENTEVVSTSALKLNRILEAGATLWFNNEFLLHYIVPEWVTRGSWRHAILQKIELD